MKAVKAPEVSIQVPRRVTVCERLCHTEKATCARTGARLEIAFLGHQAMPINCLKNNRLQTNRACSSTVRAGDS